MSINMAMIAARTVTNAFTNVAWGLRLIIPIEMPKYVFKLEKSENLENSTKNPTMEPDLIRARSVGTEFARSSRLEYPIRRVLIRVLTGAHRNRCATARGNRE